MGSPYVIELDGYVFPRGDIPFRGPLEELAPQRWANQPILGAASPGSVLTFMGFESQVMEFESRASTTTKEKLVDIYNAQEEVTFKTPQNTTGFKVLMTRLRVAHREPIENSKWLCQFTLVNRTPVSGILVGEEDVPIIIRKAVTETVNNSDVLQNDNELLFAIGANETWIFDFVLLHTGIATSDIKVSWVAPAGATGSGWIGGRTTADAEVKAATGISGSSQSFGSAIATQIIMGSIVVVNGGTAGNIQLRWAQNVAEANNTNMLALSYIAAWKQ